MAASQRGSHYLHNGLWDFIRGLLCRGDLRYGWAKSRDPTTYR